MLLFLVPARGPSRLVTKDSCEIAHVGYCPW